VTKSTINRGRLSSFGHSLTHNSHKLSGAQVWEECSCSYCNWVFGLGFWFVDFLFGALFLERERYAISWLSVGSGTASRIILSVKVMVLGGGCVPMVG
jgi:hypothetical protein